MQGIRILVVDDMPPMRTFVKAGIKTAVSKDIEVDEASNGEAAKGKLQLQRYDLVLCDWNMPGMKGSELLQWMKEQEKLKDIPFVMVTAHNEKDIIMEAIKLGVRDYVLKPVTVDALGSKIKAVLMEAIARKEKEVK